MDAVKSSNDHGCYQLLKKLTQLQRMIFIITHLTHLHACSQILSWFLCALRIRRPGVKHNSSGAQQAQWKMRMHPFHLEKAPVQELVPEVELNSIGWMVFLLVYSD